MVSRAASNLDSLPSLTKSWSSSRKQSLLNLRVNPNLNDLLRVLPSLVMTRAGMTPDPWQMRLLSFQDQESFRLAVNCSRQIGKTTATSALALLMALLNPRSDIVVVSRTQRQTAEVIRKVEWFRLCLLNPMSPLARTWQPVDRLDGLINADLKAEDAQDASVVRDAVTMKEFPNRSRIIALPGKSAGAIMGYAVKLLIIDEACWFPDATYEDIPPMLARTRGSMICLSYGGFLNGSWWDKAWHRERAWERIRVTASEVGHFEPGFLKAERERLSPQSYQRNYECGFTPEEGAFFDPRDVARCFV